MDYFQALHLVLWLITHCDTGAALPHGIAHSLANKRLKRQNSRSAFDPPVPPFPSPENPTFSIPAPYPLPTTVAPILTPRTARISRFVDSSNPYLEALTDSYYPNYGFGLLVHQPVLISGGLNWPTGNILQPIDKFGGNLGLDRPVELRFGTQGGPFYPWQDSKFTKTIRDINAATSLAQRAQLSQNYARILDDGGQENPFVIAAPARSKAQNRIDQVPVLSPQSFASAVQRSNPLSSLFGRNRVSASSH